MYLCVCVCVSVTRWYCIKTAARIYGADFWHIGASLDLSCSVLRILGISYNNSTFVWNFVSNSDLQKFGRSMCTVAECDKQATVVVLLSTTLGDVVNCC